MILIQLSLIYTSSYATRQQEKICICSSNCLPKLPNAMLKVGDHLKALNLIEQLHQQNYIHQNLTDLKFLAGIGISSQSLEQMRRTEVRALS